jgi:hypothetical protein
MRTPYARQRTAIDSSNTRSRLNNPPATSSKRERGREQSIVNLRAGMNASRYLESKCKIGGLICFKGSSMTKWSVILSLPSGRFCARGVYAMTVDGPTVAIIDD